MTLKKLYQINDSELYNRYCGQSHPQPTVLSLDLEAETLKCEYLQEVGGGCSAKVFHGRTIQWAIPVLKRQAANKLIENASHWARVILRNSEIRWSGCNWVGKLNPVAIEAQSTIQDIIDDINTDDFEIVYSPWDVGEYYTHVDLSTLGITSKSTDDDLENLAAEEVASAERDLEYSEVLSYFEDYRDELKEEDE